MFDARRTDPPRGRRRGPARPAPWGCHSIMFFIVSKVAWFFADPGNLLLIVLGLGVWLLWTRWRRAGRWLVSLAALAALAMATLPLGARLFLPLENRFPVAGDLPKRIDGIITLGGVVDQFVTRARGQVALGGAVERLTEFAALARRYPDARLVFTSGSGDLFRQDVKEADVLGPFLDVLGLDRGRILFENQSRNTYENAVLTFGLVRPDPGEKWILITSAFHMPRAVGCFRRAGWRVIPYPVDFDLRGDETFDVSFDFVDGIDSFAGGLHEWLGLTFYWLTGRTDAFFPAPEV